MYDRILVPTDGSEAAEAAAETGLELAESFGATVHVLYVIDESASKLLLSSKSMRDTIAELSKRGEAATTTIADRARDAGVAVETDVVRGMGIHDAIVEYAVDNDVDVIVMGTAGRRGIEHFLGSTTERVITTSPVPVMAVTVPMGDETSQSDDEGIDRDDTAE